MGNRAEENNVVENSVMENSVEEDNVEENSTKGKLSLLSLDELWGLSPIFLTEYKDEWSGWSEEEKLVLECVLPMERTVRIAHMGSTAIRSIWAKPIVDILMEMTSEGGMEEFRSSILQAGYTLMSKNESRVSFSKGYTGAGFAKGVFHLHLRKSGDHHESYFRDYMREHLKAAGEYEALKLKLWGQYEHGRDAYTENKSELVNKHTVIVRTECKGRYDGEQEGDIWFLNLL